MSQPAVKVADAELPAPWHKRLEVALRLFFGALASGLFARPWRRKTREAALRRCRKVLLVRIDERVGEALLTTPVLESLRASPHRPEVHLLVHAKVARVLVGHPAADRIIAFDRRSLALGPLAPAIRALRAERYDVIVNCSSWYAPSVTPALVARLAGGSHAAIVGPSVEPIRRYHSHPVLPLSGTTNEVVQRVHLLSPLPEVTPVHRLSFREPSVGSEVKTFLESLSGVPYGVVNPGGRLDWRRVSSEVFAAAAAELVRVGITPVVSWGPGEERLASKLVQAVPGARLAPKTSIDELGALMRGARLTVCNNTGPMHLSVAVGTATIAFFLLMDVQRWGHPGAPHQMVDLTPERDDLTAQKARARAAVAKAVGVGQEPGRTHG